MEQIRLIDDGEWGSLLLENGTVDDISNNLVHLLVMPEDRQWDQFFFFVKPIIGSNASNNTADKEVLVEADFLETVASVKSRLFMESVEDRVPNERIGLVYKWNQLRDEMTFDDEQVDVTVGCTLDFFVKEEESGGNDQC